MERCAAGRGGKKVGQIRGAMGGDGSVNLHLLNWDH